MHPKWLLWTTLYLWKVTFLSPLIRGIWQGLLKAIDGFWDTEKLFLLTGKKLLVRIFDKIANGTMKEGKKLSSRIIEMHKRRQGSPRKRKGPITGTKGTDRFRSEEAFYVNPLPDCLCQKESTIYGNSTAAVLK
ncbi:O-fucosyltransferase 7-like isoform X1 [Bidens hawaiensis]|uniref:O-fucosyltransferase 7-like isoform X1 n=1 Tax=Bidens hawaiensis TaxID=980011 RepID=UPI00404918BD